MTAREVKDQNLNVDLAGGSKDPVLRCPRLTPRSGETEVERFWMGVERGPACWRWMGAIDHIGYGRFYRGGRYISAHRHSAIWGRHLSADEIVDHTCRNRGCVNPGHLRVVDARTNALENSMGRGALNAKKTHCPHGHPLDRVGRDRGKPIRFCSVCHARAREKYMAKRRECK